MDLKTNYTGGLISLKSSSKNISINLPFPVPSVEHFIIIISKLFPSIISSEKPKMHFWSDLINQKHLFLWRYPHWDFLKDCAGKSSTVYLYRESSSYQWPEINSFELRYVRFYCFLKSSNANLRFSWGLIRN